MSFKEPSELTPVSWIPSQLGRGPGEQAVSPGLVVARATSVFKLLSCMQYKQTDALVKTVATGIRSASPPPQTCIQQHFLLHQQDRLTLPRPGWHLVGPAPAPWGKARAGLEVRACPNSQPVGMTRVSPRCLLGSSKACPWPPKPEKAVILREVVGRRQNTRPVAPVTYIT
uniref:Uncharacterized protein n=1 Tax=Pipistrellus kuhlii TaxID=59472 RepID=A0A7J7Y916_PIPKU|nr:hypothetical protein mPipKuh1_010289 [Pipistrellus kuhlii]